MTSKVEAQMAKAEVAYQKQLQLNLVELVRRYEQAIQRVREIHRKHELLNYCLHCGVDVQDPLGPQQYPCPTVKALDGEQE